MSESRPSGPIDPKGPKDPKRLREPGGALRQVGMDLKAVLADVSGRVDRLVPQAPDELDERQEYSALKRSLDQANTLADTLLGTERTQSRGRWIVDLNAFIAAREEALRSLVNPDVSITVRLSAASGFVLAFPPDLEMLLGRLVESGGRAMPTGGEIVITTGWLHLVSGGLPPSGFGAIRHVRLTVGDTGRLDDEAMWKRVLEPEKGAHIVHADDCIAALVQRLGGWLLVENAEGEGCRIHVCLPTMMNGGDAEDTK